MKISLTCTEIRHYAQRYNNDREDDLSRRLKAAKSRGYMTRQDLIEVAKWKWPGGIVRQYCKENTNHEVKEISRVSFHSKSDRLRIGVLMALHGVNWPMASVILHFAFRNRYPILDVRAMSTVGGSTSYNFERWMEYVYLCRKKAKECNITMRELDRSLWQYDKDKRASA